MRVTINHQSRGPMYYLLLFSVAALPLFAQALDPDVPAVSVRRTAPQSIEISWSRGDWDWVLEETRLLSATAQWNETREAAIIRDAEFVVMVRAEASQKFYRLRVPDLTTIAGSSPAHGETGVAVTRETVLVLSHPLAATNLINNTQLYAEAAGRRILSRVELGSDRQIVTLFYLEDLPGSARVQVTLNGSGLFDTSGRPLDSDGDGQPGGIGKIQFDTLTLTPIAGTAVIGKVFASELVPGAGTTGQSTNRPLEGVTITVDGMEETLRARTDAQGNFRLEPVPAGRFFVHVDGRTAVGSQWPDGSYYPYVGKAWDAVAGVTTNLASGTGEIFLPKIVQGTLKPVSVTEATSVTFPPEVLQKNPELAGVVLSVPPNNLVSPDGVRGGRLGIAPVPPDRLPEPLPPGLEFPIVITVQTDGAENFDQPVPVCFPNLPDPGTGQPLPPGTRNYLYSFDHDIGQFVPVGPMTVSADGKLICTDPGVGIREPGWHGSGPPPVEPPPPEDCKVGKEKMDLCLARCLEVLNQCREAMQEWVIARQEACLYYADDARKRECTAPIFREYKERMARCENTYGACVDQCVDCYGLGQNSPSNSALSYGSEGRLVSFNQSPGGRITGLIDQMSELLSPYIDRGQTVPSSVWQQYDALAAELSALNPGSYLKALILAGEEKLARLTGGEYWNIGNAPPYPILYVATISRPSGLFYLRGETAPFGQYSLFIPRDGKLLDVSFYDPRTREYGTVFPIQSPNSPYRVPPVLMGPLPTDAADLDDDGLADLVELVFGTDWDKADSDNDSITDGAEVAQGSNPLDGLGVRTGVIAAVDTAGTAADIAIQNDLAVVADSVRGVAIFDLSSGLTPTLAGVLDTPGTARAVARSGNWAAVADGNFGMAIIDMSNPSAARLTRQLDVGGSVQAVAAAGGIAFAGVSTGLVAAVDLATGAVLKSIHAGDEVNDLQIEGDTLFVLLGDEIKTYRILPTLLEFLGRVAASDSGADSFTNRRRLFVGGGIAYAVTLTGFQTFDVRNPLAMLPLGPLRETGPRSFKQIVPDGYGFGVGAVGINSSADGMHDVWLYDLSNPALTDKFLTTLPTPGIARAAAIYIGLAYVADGDAGLQVVNYRESDRSTNAPTISLTSNFSPGKAEEGKTMRVTADARDDVQVRDVEIYLDGVLIQRDGSFPFDFYFQTPRTSAQKTSFRLKARATDTAGNSTWTPEIVFNLVADATPPRVLIVSPSPGGFLAPGAEVAAIWSEPLNAATVNSSTFQLVSAGADQIHDTSDDAVVSGGAITYRPETNGTVMTFSGDLPAGEYRAILSTGITDLSGNPAGAAFSWTFTSAARIGYGQVLTGTIAKAGQKFFYAFTAGAGDRVHIRLAETGPLSPYLEFLDSAGNKIAERYSFGSEAVLDQIIQNAGTFFFSASDKAGTATANFGVYIQRLNGPAGASTIAFGQTLAGAIDNVAETDSYTFQAAAGDRIRLRMSEPGPLSPNVELYNPDGEMVREDSSFGSEGTVDHAVSAAGTYLVLLSDYAGSAKGAYAVSLQRLSNPAGAKALGFGQVIAGRIDSFAQADAYSFQAAAGDKIRIRMSEPGPLSPRVELFDPQGVEIAEDGSFGSDAVIDYTVVVGGTFLILASDYNGIARGDYAIFLQRMSAPVGGNAIAFGQTVAGSIDSFAEADSYTFQAATGDRIRIRMTEPGPLSPQLELFNAQGAKVGEDSGFGSEALLDYRVAAGGTFVILASDYSGSSKGGYALFLQRLSMPEAGIPLAYGQTVAGNIDDLAEAHAYNFQAAAGERIRVRMSEPGPLSPTIELFDPLGEKVGEDSSFSSEALLDYTVPTAGRYLVLASDYSGTEKGDYAIFIQRLNGPLGARPLGFAQPVTGSIDNLAEEDAFAFQAAVGDRLRIRLSEPGPISPQLELFDAQGVRLAADSSFSNEALIEYQLQTGGAFFLLVSDYEGSNRGTYTLLLER